MQKLLREISVWVKQNKGEVCFVGSFCSFDKKGEVKDDFIGSYGVKKCIKEQVKEISKLLKEEKSDFVNW